MHITALVPYAVAERCFLSEALSWVANYRLPLAPNIDEDDFDKFIDGLVPQLADADPLSDAECVRAGLPPNPCNAVELGDPWEEVSIIKSWLRQAKGEAEQTKLLQALIEAETVVGKQMEWDALYEEYLDLHRCRLFLALREGRVRAVGKSLPRSTFKLSVEEARHPDWEDWQPIPASFWVVNKINWTENWAEGRNRGYYLIRLEFEQLFEQFPPQIENASGIVKVGDLFALDRSNDSVPIEKVRRGRPAASWDEFHVEVARRIQQGGLPAKQESFIADMQEWCWKKWGRNIARSTLSQKLKPYYDAFVRNPKSQDI